MESPLRVTVFDKSLVRTAWCEDFVEHRVMPRHLLMGSASLVVPTDYRKLAALAADGARAVVELERNGQTEQLLSGKIRNLEAQGNSRTGLTTFDIEDDFRVVYNLLGYPSPNTWQPDANGVITQAAASDDRSGPAETVAKGYLSANLARWAGRTLPYTVAASLGRGTNVSVTGMRMLALSEKLLPALANSGIGISVRQTATGLLVDTYVTSLFPIHLSEDGGTVDAWKINKTAYTGTAAVAGGPNAGTSREFRYVVDAVREGKYNDVIESLVDASDQTVAAKILAKATDQVATLGDKWSVDLTLTESSAFRYGGPGGVHVGDSVAVDFPVDLPSITAVVNEAELAFTRDEGYTAKFTVGLANTDPDDITADLLQQLVTAVHEIRAR